MSRSRGALVAAALAALVALLPWTSASADPALPPAVREVDLEEHLGLRLDGALPLTDMTGRAVRLGDSFPGEKPVLLVLAYYRCPMLCGLVLRGLVDGLRKLDFQLDEQYRVLTVSFDPRDTPEAARAKRQSTLGALGLPETSPAWPFLVGPEASTRALADQLGFRFAYDARTDQYAHPAAVVVLNPDGRIARYLYGVDFTPRDLRLALLEAGEGKTGSLAERVVLTCYRYDPASRRYGAYVLGFMRLGALGILASVVLLLTVLWSRERRA